MGGPVDYEQMKLTQQAMNATVLQRAKEHPGNPMKIWKLLLIIGGFFTAMILFVVLLELGVFEKLFYG